ncbi:hypothetical protein [Tropicimonas sp. S265A]|uniref:hypothetical protein n=1 Tax=Tropicimonas sp. S265A TaxID=3415134 RepID=UPI003C7A9B13
MDTTLFANDSTKIARLRTIVQECHNWKVAKAAKLNPNDLANFSQNTANRAAVVTQLNDQAMQLLRYYVFKNRKANAMPNVPGPGGLRSLQGGHTQERAVYAHNKATGNKTANFPGGSLVEANMAAYRNNAAGAVQAFGPPPANVQAILANNAKDFDNLTPGEFDVLANHFTGHELAGQFPVHYVDKTERVNNNMLVVVNNHLRNSTGGPYTTQNLDMWALDKYGNLMVANANAMTNGNQYNHSSLNAGQNVICAGTCVIQNGIIMEIDNQSGHYKPTRLNLQTALKVLVNDVGAPFAVNCIVRDFAPPQRRFVNYQAFLLNLNAAGTANFP